MNINRLKDLREDYDLTQKEVADILHTTQQQYSKYELGIRLIPVDKLNLLADYYKTTVYYLIGRSNIKEPKNKRIKIKIFIRLGSCLPSFLLHR